MSFSKQEFVDCLNELGLSKIEAAKLLSVTLRTLNRWFENPNKIYGPAEQALRAWIRLHRYYLPWRPDGFSIEESCSDSPEKISLRNHCIGLADILERVKDQGGSKLPWQIDFSKRGIAKLETIEVYFYTFPGGGFIPVEYIRTDMNPILNRDWEILEDAFFAISQAMDMVKDVNH